MGQMDIAATGSANGRVAVLLHSKNFCAATWEDSIKALSDAGYRVLVPDQIGIALPDVKAKLGHYQVLGKQVAAMIPGAELMEFPGMGHAPQMDEPEVFNKALIAGLVK